MLNLFNSSVQEQLDQSQQELDAKSRSVDAMSRSVDGQTASQQQMEENLATLEKERNELNVQVRTCPDLKLICF